MMVKIAVQLVLLLLVVVLLLLQSWADVGSVLPEGLADLLPGLDVTDVPPRAIFGVLLEEAARRIQAADGLDDLGGDVGLLQLARGGAEVARLVGGDEGAEADVAWMGVDAPSPAGEDVIDVGFGDGTHAPGRNHDLGGGDGPARGGARGGGRGNVRGNMRWASAEHRCCRRLGGCRSSLSRIDG